MEKYKVLVALFKLQGSNNAWTDVQSITDKGGTLLSRTRKYLNDWNKEGIIEKKRRKKYLFFRLNKRGRRKAILWSLKFK